MAEKNVRLLFPNCNYNCLFCHGEGIYGNTKIEITPKNIMPLINKAVNAGFSKTLVFSGGEPLLSFETLKEFSSYFKNEFRYVLITNGSFIDQQVAEWISAMGVEVHVNIPSFYHEKYPTIIRSGVSLQSILDNLKRIDNTVIKINYVLCNEVNCSEDDILCAINACRIHGYRTLRIIEHVDFENKSKYFFSLDKLLNYSLFQDKQCENRNRRCIKYSFDLVDVELVRCSCALNCEHCFEDKDLYISSDGFIHPCYKSKLTIPLFSQDSFEQYMAFYKELNIL